MSTARIRLETSDFTVECTPDGRIHLFVSGERDDAEIDMDPGVAMDLLMQLANPEDAS